MEQIRAEPLIGPTATPAPGPRVPGQPSRARVEPLAPAPSAPPPSRSASSRPSPEGGTRGHRPGDTGAARGEHVHSEPPPPRVVPQRHSVRAQILEALRAALLSGELAPGQVYSAPALAERFGVSPTPVREAMQQLASEGAVATVPNRGFRIAEHSARDLAELAEIRALLEVPAVLRLARTVPAERWAQLRPLAEDTLEAASRGDRTAYAEADRVFHRALLELTGNRQLVTVADDVHRRAQCSSVRVAPAPRTTDLLAEAADHLALLDALTAQDLPTVERLVRGHY